MLLPKNERKLLISYYRTWIAGKSSFSFEKPLDEAAHLHLRDLRLIVIDFNIPGGRISLTAEGINLAQKYTSWWSRSNLWYAEYIKNHWIWIIVSFLSGLLGGLLINWLSG